MAAQTCILICNGISGASHLVFETLGVGGWLDGAQLGHRYISRRVRTKNQAWISQAGYDNELISCTS
jgi:hypothetical protein